MVEERIMDGKRIAQLLASEVTGRSDGPLGRLAVADADRDAEPTDDGARAYDLERDGEPFAEVYVQPDRVRIEFREGIDVATKAAEREGLRVRPKATRPPRTLVFVESGAEVKRAVAMLVAAVDGAVDG
jgi:hypothetical protein